MPNLQASIFPPLHGFLLKLWDFHHENSLNSNKCWHTVNYIYFAHKFLSLKVQNFSFITSGQERRSGGSFAAFTFYLQRRLSKTQTKGTGYYNSFATNIKTILDKEVQLNRRLKYTESNQRNREQVWTNQEL